MKKRGGQRKQMFFILRRISPKNPPKELPTTNIKHMPMNRHIHLSGALGALVSALPARQERLTKKLRATSGKNDIKKSMPEKY